MIDEYLTCIPSSHRSAAARHWEKPVHWPDEPVQVVQSELDHVSENSPKPVLIVFTPNTTRNYFPQKFFRKKSARDLLPAKPVEISVEPWWVAQTGYITEDDIRVSLSSVYPFLLDYTRVKRLDSCCCGMKMVPLMKNQILLTLWCLVPVVIFCTSFILLIWSDWHSEEDNYNSSPEFTWNVWTFPLRPPHYPTASGTGLK